jgi:hypothetical protein
VWQVFNFPLQAIIELGKNEESFIVKGIKQPEEILTYLADRSIE